ncbi:type II toxin-antitoxin system MqsA family antitoxin [Candidatus Symbiopectobacterium sp. 'North America']|uniref:type II toxin-antitoxin system MqsA family antitoxin n=1 Tax=Candidatus Symbiopectobacterium sp. 'North America' TaxID=2794574 RepID=UPI001FD26095|nr:type II toxin-antitoxin system MqsA family antitoxin [Candidatus Symbiopectobacterium sp. 'North America']
MLTVYSDGIRYRLHYITLDRTNPSAEECAQGIKEKRFETLNREFYLKKGKELVLSRYPQPELTEQFKAFLESTEGKTMITEKPTPAQVAAARAAAKMTQREASERFGIGVNAWQKKEADGPSHRDLSVGEYNYLLMLANDHPEFLAIRRLPKDKNPRQDAARLAYELAQYLSSGDFKEIVVPSAVDAMMKTLQDKVSELRAEWESDIDYKKGEL